LTKGITAFPKKYIHGSGRRVKHRWFDGKGPYRRGRECIDAFAMRVRRGFGLKLNNHEP